LHERFHASWHCAVRGAGRGVSGEDVVDLVQDVAGQLLDRLRTGEELGQIWVGSLGAGRRKLRNGYTILRVMQLIYDVVSTSLR